MRRLRCSVVLLLSLLAAAGPAYADGDVEEPGSCIPTSSEAATEPEDPIGYRPYGRT